MIPLNPAGIAELVQIIESSLAVQSVAGAIPNTPDVIEDKKILRQQFHTTMETLVKVLGKQRQSLVELGFVSTVDQVDRIMKQYKPGIDYKEAAPLVRQFIDRLLDDLKRGECFMVPPEKVGFYKTAAFYFGEQVNAVFPSAQRDIEDAAKCYAFGRNTACVFHLMRVMEIGLQALGKSLNNPNLDPNRNPSWDAILKKCDDELKLPLKDRSPEWKTDDQFYSDATANLRAVKNAWRNPTMHVRASYDDEQAKDVMNAVKGFMRHLGTKLYE